jgi:hypothetical protein
VTAFLEESTDKLISFTFILHMIPAYGKHVTVSVMVEPNSIAGLD